MPINDNILEEIKSNKFKSKSLDLKSAQLKWNDIYTLANAFTNNIYITFLDLTSNHIGPEGAKALATITSLKSLKIGNYNRVGDEGAEALAFSNLTSLDLTGNEIGLNGAKALAKNTTILNLNLGFNNIEDKGAEAFACNTTLSYLNLSGNQITNLAIHAFSTNTTLKSFAISNNHLDNDCVKDIVSIVNLKSLDISYNNIGPKGAEILASSLSIRCLNISNNKIGDDGIRSLSVNPNIYSLTIEYCDISEEGVKALEINTNLTFIKVEDNFLWLGRINQVVTRNLKALIERRRLFFQTLIELANDKNKPDSQSNWSRLPMFLMLHIISLIEFSAIDSIRKNPQQIHACAFFIFNNVLSMREALKESTIKKQSFKLIEKIKEDKSFFWFYPSRTLQNFDSFKDDKEIPICKF